LWFQAVCECAGVEARSLSAEFLDQVL